MKSMESRKTEFRGKRLDNGEWVYGDLIHTDSGETLIVTGWCYGFVFERFAHEVIPETVGEYTGLQVKNSVKVFEDDFIKTKFFGILRNGVNFNDFDIFQVMYSPPAFGLENERNSGWLGHAIDRETDFEVIGNIHDNPELLEAVNGKNSN